MEKAGELQMLLEAQRQELMASRTLESDLDFAFKLQMQEALSASYTSSSSSLPPPHAEFSNSFKNDDDAYISDLLLQEIQNYEQESMDFEQCRAEMQKMKNDLNIRMHDQRFATDIVRIPDQDWQKYGDNYHRPYSTGSPLPASSSSSSSNYLEINECFRLYFKGLVIADGLSESGRETLGAFGVAICDPKDNVVFELGKPLVLVEDGRQMNGDIADIEALIEGLNFSLSLELKRIVYFCDDHMLHRYLSGQDQPNDGNTVELIKHVEFLQKKFKYCNSILVAHKDIKFAFQLARSALVHQIGKPVASSSSKLPHETCAICFEDTKPQVMFSVDDCQHRYCFFCIKMHVEVKLLHGALPRCPHEGCKSGLNMRSCKKLLSPRLLEVMSQLVKEASIPVTDRFYCPNPRCSTLMSRAEVTRHSAVTYVKIMKYGACECYKCHELFCIHCKVPWHTNMSCSQYMKLNPNHNSAEAKLKTLATRRLWRQCLNCKHMVELAEGCYHITCRCGHQFCYTCGAAWKNKKATCSCVLWDERNIIHRENARRQ